MNEVHVSARLTTLHQAIAGGHRAALDDFWRDVAAAGAPLVEPIDGDNGHVLVTFVYRGDSATRNVVVVGGATGYGCADNRMIHMPRTDLWYRSVRMPADVSTTYQISVNDALDEGAWGARIAASRPDPLNPATFFVGADPEEEGDVDLLLSRIDRGEERGEEFEGGRDEVAAGDCRLVRFESRLLGNTRRVWLYTPPGYGSHGLNCPVAFVLDGLFYNHVLGLPALLDRAIANGVLPPLVAIMVGNVDQATRSHELNCSPAFAGFLSGELAPWVGSELDISMAPERTAIVGASYGALAAAFAALSAPDVFGNVVSQSGAFGWKPDADREHSWLIRRFEGEPCLAIRFHLTVGVMETWLRAGSGPDRLSANRSMRDTLIARGYDVDYREYSGGHDYPCWRRELIDGFVSAFGKPEAARNVSSI